MMKLKPISEAIEQTKKYIKDRMDGRVKSLKTGYKKLDDSTIDGIEFNSTVTIGARPSIGKSVYSSCLIEGCFANNLDENLKPDFDLLDCSWELSYQVELIRRISSKMKKTYKQILSADGSSISQKDYDEIVRALDKEFSNLPIVFTEEPSTVNEFLDGVKRQVDKTKRKTLVRVDHTLITKQSASEGSQVLMLLNLLSGANIIKKQYPVIFLFLTQLLRDVEDRQEDGTDKAFMRQSDVYGSDAAAMFSETILLLNRPSKYGVSYYGKRPGGVVVEPNDLFCHIVKNRNAGGDIILHYKEDFKNMNIIEW